MATQSAGQEENHSAAQGQGAGVHAAPWAQQQQQQQQQEETEQSTIHPWQQQQQQAANQGMPMAVTPTVRHYLLLPWREHLHCLPDASHPVMQSNA